MTDLGTMWDAAEQRDAQRRKDRPMSFYGKLSVEGRKVVFEKGAPMGKRDFDPQLDDPDAERLAIRLTVEPVSERATKNFEREFVTSTGEGDLFQQSVRALGLRPAEVMGKYVRLDLVEDPRLGQYNDRTTGMPRTRTGPVLRELFPDEETCREAADARYGGNKAGGTPSAQHAGDWGVTVSTSPGVAPNAPANGGTVASTNGGTGSNKAPGMTREVAAHFLPGLLKTVGNDREKFLAALSTNSLLSPHFDATSPEVVALVGEAGDDANVPF